MTRVKEIEGLDDECKEIKGLDGVIKKSPNTHTSASATTVIVPLKR